MLRRGVLRKVYDQALQEAFGGRYLRQDKSVDEMTSEDYDALADRVFTSFEEQGAFDSVNEAVQEALEGLQQERQEQQEQQAQP